MMRGVSTLSLSAVLLVQLSSNTHDCLAGSLVSQSSSRLPMALSTVISDLEAEGVGKLNTATVLFSRSADRSRLFPKLMDDGDEESIDSSVTALGQCFGDDEDDETDEDEEKLGLALAAPNRGVSDAAETAMTVLATHGTVVFVCERVDLERGEGLFEGLAPAVERLWMMRQQEEKDEASSSSNTSTKLIVLFEGVPPNQIEAAQATFLKAAQTMLSTLLVKATTRLEGDVFDRVSFLCHDDPDLYETLMTSLLGDPNDEEEHLLKEPYQAAESVATAVAAGVLADPITKSLTSASGLSARDLAAFTRLQPAYEAALATAVQQVQDVVESGSDEAGFVPQFGALVDAVVNRAVASLDSTLARSSARLRRAPLARRRGQDLREAIAERLQDAYQQQQDLMSEAAFVDYTKDLAKLKISPTLPQDMEDVVESNVKDWKTRAASLTPKSWSSTGGTTHTSLQPFVRRIRAYSTERLQRARVGGNFRPAPRKGTTIGLHWLLPKPFGHDWRQNPSDIYKGTTLFYDKSTPTEVGPEGVAIADGDWRRKIVPVPSSTEMMYDPATKEE